MVNYCTTHLFRTAYDALQKIVYGKLSRSPRTAAPLSGLALLVACGSSGGGGGGSPPPTPTNNPPVVFSQPFTIAQVGQQYVYNFSVADPEGDPLSYSINGPQGMVIDLKTGKIYFTPQTAGSFPVSAQVTDGVNPAVIQSYVLVVQPVPTSSGNGGGTAPVSTSTNSSPPIGGGGNTGPGTNNP